MDRLTSFSLRSFAAADIPAGFELSQSVGWAHRLENWTLMHEVGRGQVAVDETGKVRGVAMWWPQGPDFATVGMVIVAPDVQRAGIGRRLMNQIIEDMGDRRIQLVATQEGQPLYESLGFRVTGGILSCNITPSASIMPVLSDLQVRAMTEADREAVCQLDERASRADRRDLLVGLFATAEGFVAARNDAIVGYALCHQWGRGHTVGPVVAEDEEAALAVLSSAAVETGGLIHVDLVSDAALIRQWLEAAGLQNPYPLNVMQRGTTPAREKASIFSLASQGLG